MISYEVARGQCAGWAGKGLEEACLLLLGEQLSQALEVGAPARLGWGGHGFLIATQMHQQPMPIWLSVAEPMKAQPNASSR